MSHVDEDRIFPVLLIVKEVHVQWKYCSIEWEYCAIIIIVQFLEVKCLRFYYIKNTPRLYILLL